MPWDKEVGGGGGVVVKVDFLKYEDSIVSDTTIINNLEMGGSGAV